MKKNKVVHDNKNYTFKFLDGVKRNKLDLSKNELSLIIYTLYVVFQKTDNLENRANDIEFSIFHVLYELFDELNVNYIVNIFSNIEERESKDDFNFLLEKIITEIKENITNFSLFELDDLIQLNLNKYEKSYGENINSDWLKRTIAHNGNIDRDSSILFIGSDDGDYLFYCAKHKQTFSLTYIDLTQHGALLIRMRSEFLRLKVNIHNEIKEINTQLYDQIIISDVKSIISSQIIYQFFLSFELFNSKNNGKIFLINHTSHLNNKLKKLINEKIFDNQLKAQISFPQESINIFVVGNDVYEEILFYDLSILKGNYPNLFTYPQDLLRVFDEIDYAKEINSLAKIKSKVLYEDQNYNKYFANYHITKLKLKQLILEIPNAIELSEISQFRQGRIFAKRRTSYDDDSGFTSIMVSDLDESSTDIYVRKSSGYIKSLNVKSISSLEKKCVLVCLVRKLKPKIFDPKNFKNDIYINKNIVAIYPSESYSLEYIIYLLSSPMVTEQLNLLRAKNRINIKSLSSIKVSIAETIQEQKRFILSHKMALIEQEESRVVKLRDALELKEEQEEAEFEIVRHISHNLNPKLSEVSSVLSSIKEYLELNGLLQEALYEPINGDETEKIGEAISSAMTRVNMIHRLIRSTRSLVVDRVAEKDFKLVEPFKFLTEILQTLNNISDKSTVNISNNSKRKNARIKVNHDYLRELFENLVRNSNTHGFTSCDPHNHIIIKIETIDDSIIFDYMNNGKLLPDDLDVDNFLQYGVKGIDSPGDGLGGAFIRKVLKAHNGEFEIVKNLKGANFKLVLPLYIGDE